MAFSVFAITIIHIQRTTNMTFICLYWRCATFIDIVCFFAAKGVWPFYPSVLQFQVNEMGKKLFTQSDDKIRQFCRGKFNFPDTCYRPGLIIMSLSHMLIVNC